MYARLKFQRILNVRDCEFIEPAGLPTRGPLPEERSAIAPGAGLDLRTLRATSRNWLLRRDRPGPLEKPFGAQHPLQARRLVCTWREPALRADGGRRNWAVQPPTAPKMICGTPVFLAGADLLSSRGAGPCLRHRRAHDFTILPATERRSVAYLHEPIRARTRRRFGFDFSAGRSLSKPVIPRFGDALTHKRLDVRHLQWLAQLRRLLHHSRLRTS
jgi:hypothetical protein